MAQLVLATGNKGKINEMAHILRNFGISVRSLKEFPEIGEIIEDGDTFEANALIKARTVCEKTGLIAMADDSGLVVDALDGAPGVYSARYAGEHGNDEANIDKLLAELGDTPEEKRTARFVCSIVVCTPSGETLTAEGTWEGRILFERQGSQGFGYDPVFFDPTLGKASAELEREVKHQHSHRGKALEKLLAAWPEFWAKVNK